MIVEPLTYLIPPQPVDDATQHEADELFERLRLESRLLGDFELWRKRDEWRQIYAAVKQATQLGGTLVFKFGNRVGALRTLSARQVVEAAVDLGILIELPRAHRLNPRRFELAKITKPKRKRKA